MLSLSKGMTASQAGKYFAAEDYYLKGGESSRWLGKGAAALKLAGKVTEETFRNVAAGKTPDGSLQLVAPKLTRGEDGSQEENHRAGNDLTFSAPKSLSVGYAAGNHELKEIWDRAVENAMRYVEEHYSQYRTPGGMRNAGNLLAAKFDHVTSRALDPDVHSHVFLLNMVQTAEERWLANEPQTIYKDKISIGMLARQEAIRLLREAGYQVYFTDREKFLFEITGVTREEMEVFSKRSAAIEEQVAKWRQEGKYPGVGEALLRQWAGLDTRDPKFKVTNEEVRRYWDKCFEEVKTTAREVLERIEAEKSLAQGEELKPYRYLPPARGSVAGTLETVETAQKGFPADQNPTLEKTPREILEEASSFLTDKEVLFTRGQLIKTAVKISGGEHHISELGAAVEDKTLFHSLGVESSGPNAGQEFLTTREMLRLERQNLAALRELPPFRSLTSRPEVEAFLKGISGKEEGSLTPDQVPFREAFVRGAASAAPTGFLSLTPGQREYVLNELTGEKGFAVTQGDPGTGKTFAFGVIERFNAEVLKPTGRAHHALNIAYTNKAALEMEKASDNKAYTVDSFLNRFYQKGPAAFCQELCAPNGAQVVIRLDEASLVGGRQAEHLLKVVRELKARELEAKPSLIGDFKQFPSIQASPFFIHASQLARERAGDYTVMKEIVRQKDAALLDVARTLNRDREIPLLGENAVDALKMLKQQGRVREIPTYEALVSATVRHYLEQTGQPSPDPAAAAAGKKQSVLIVTPLNADRQELNRKIREARIEKGELGQGTTVQVLVPVGQGVTASGYLPGMTVCFTGERRKDGSINIPEGIPGNGEGKVVSINLDQNKVKLSFQDERGQQRTRSFDAVELARKSALYQEEEREFAAGDTIVCNKTTYDKSIVSARSGKKIKIRNAELGEIETIETTREGAVALVKLSEDRLARVNLDRHGPQHLDHGYVITIHKGEGTTVDSVIDFAFVRPFDGNEQKALQALAGIETTAERFERWNSALSPYEREYRLETRLGDHAGTLSLIMIRNRQSNQEQKGIAVSFANGQEMLKDEPTRLLMRGEGMYWVRDLGVWVTAITNDRAMDLMNEHPLRDQEYLAYLKESLATESPAPSVESGSAPLAEIDSKAQTERFGRTSYNAFNIALTRSRSEAAVFTNSWNGLIKGVGMVDLKTSTVKEAGQRPGESHTVARGTEQPRSQPAREPTRKVEIAAPTPAVPQPVREIARELKKPK